MRVPTRHQQRCCCCCCCCGCGSTCRIPPDSTSTTQHARAPSLSAVLSHATRRPRPASHSGRCHVSSWVAPKTWNVTPSWPARFSCRPHARLPACLPVHPMHMHVNASQRARHRIVSQRPLRAPSCSRTPDGEGAVCPCVMLPHATPTHCSTTYPFRPCRAWGAALYHRPRLVIGLSERDVCRCTFGTFCDLYHRRARLNRTLTSSSPCV